MSYLDAPRFHFSGTFFADPSTVNNSTENFAPNVQINDELASVTNPNSQWWNPGGSAFWKFTNITVTAAANEAGTYVTNDPLIGATIVSVISSAGPIPVYARLNDLDPDQQFRTLITGLVITVTLSGASAPALTGTVRPMNIIDLWPRMGGNNPVAAYDGGVEIPGCTFMSIVENLIWGDVSSSAALSALKNASASQLSFKINVDAYNGNSGSPDYNTGRVVGTIGPHQTSEPAHLLPKRKMSIASQLQNVPANTFPVGAALFQVENGVLTIDLGNSVPASAILAGPFMDLGSVVMLVGGDPENPVATIPIYDELATFTSQYALYAGIFWIPIDPATESLLNQHPASLQVTMPSGSATAFTVRQTESFKSGLTSLQAGAGINVAGLTMIAIGEDSTGYYVATDLNALRLESGAPSWAETPNANNATYITADAQVPIYCTLFGQPAGVEIAIYNYPQTYQFMNTEGEPWYIDNIPNNFVRVSGSTVQPLPGGMTSPSGNPPGSGPPGDQVQTFTIPDSGIGTLTISSIPYGADPAQADPRRQGLDRQVYYFDWSHSMDPPGLSVLLFQNQPYIAQPTWQDVGPILSQWATLYPAMTNIINLSVYSTVTDPTNAPLIQQMLSLDMADPAFMPVTRDLSLLRRDMILRWYKAGAPQS
jgi:hypothetical protein